MASLVKRRLAGVLTPVARRAMRLLPSLQSVIWKRAIQGRLEWRQFGFVERAHFGANFAGDIADVIQRYIYFFGRWEPHVEAVISQCLSPGDTFIDIGANIGYFSLFATTLVGETGKVVAIEPSARIFERLSENVRLNPSAATVRMVQAAVADHAGILTLHAGPDDNSGMASLLRTEGLGSEQVQARPLGSLLTDQELLSSRLIKIDVEGAEEMIIRGMQPILHKLTGSDILIELNPHLASSEAILHMVGKEGWIPYEILPADSIENYFQGPLPAKVTPLETLPTRRVDVLLRQKSRPINFQ
jgi:FkbM family methyltransferase